MTDTAQAAPPQTADKTPRPRPTSIADKGQIVLVLQGGGALGAYQAGVYQALHEAGIEPDWVIGTSIGAINAGLIAGNSVENRLPRLREFWLRMRHDSFSQMMAAMPWFGSAASNAMTVMGGVRGFFEPNPLASLGVRAPLGPEAAAFYNTAPLARTLEELVDVGALNDGSMRLTVGAAQVRTGEMVYFDSRRCELTVRHIMASGALPPAFPAIRIDGELYWDGGVLSNTPVEAVLDDNPRRDSVVFAVHIWNAIGAEPSSVYDVINREKDIRYASRAINHIARQKQIHKLRHVIAELRRSLPEELRDSPEVKELAAYGCLTRMHVVRLLAEPLQGEDHAKDIDFSPDGIRARWDAGYLDTARVLRQAPWNNDFDPLEGFILHEAAAGRMVKEG